MIETNDGDFYVECDDCGYYEEYPATNFADGIEKIKAAGWRITQNSDGEWEHLCDGCNGKGRFPL